MSTASPVFRAITVQDNADWRANVSGALKSLRSMAKQSSAATWRPFDGHASRRAREREAGQPGGVEVISMRLIRTTRSRGVAVCRSFHVTTKVAKEQIAPLVYRYRNTDQFAKVASREVKHRPRLFPAEETGRYVVAASAPAAKTPLVSDETTVSGEQSAELAVENETVSKSNIVPKHSRPARKRCCRSGAVRRSGFRSRPMKFSTRCSFRSPVTLVASVPVKRNMPRTQRSRFIWLSRAARTNCHASAVSSESCAGQIAN